MTFLKSLLNLSSVKEISLHYEYLYMNVSQGIVQLPNPLFFLCSHPSSFILCRYSFIFCQRLKQIPKGLFLSSFMGFSLSFNSLLLILQLPRLFSFYLCFIRLLTCLFPAWDVSLHTMMQTYLQAESQDQQIIHPVRFRPLRSQHLWTISMSGDYCPVHSFQFPSCLWQGDSSRPSYSIRIRTLFELDFLWNFLVVLAHFLLCRQLKFNYTEKTTY